MKPTRMMAFAFALILVPLAAQDSHDDGIKDFAYLVKMIECKDADEMLIDDTYNAFLTLLSKREVKGGGIRFPSHLAQHITKTKTNIIISWAYYITPNVLKGFELVIPREYCAEANGTLTTTTDLIVSNQNTRQGVIIFHLSPKSP